MSTTLYKNATECGDLLAFKDSAGRISYVNKADMNSELEDIYTDPEVLRVFTDSVEDFADGRFVSFTF